MLYLEDNVNDVEKISIEYDNTFHAKRHAHKHIEVLYFEKGSGIHEIDGQGIKVGNGDLYILDSGIEHSFHACDESKLLLVNIMFLSEFITKSPFLAGGRKRADGRKITE